MRYGIISDIHGNLEALEAALEALSREKIDKYVCPGDIVGYGANPRECIAKLKALKPIIVSGNHDAAVSGVTDTADFNKAAGEAILWTRKNIKRSDAVFLKGLDLTFKNEYFTLVHGTLHRAAEFHYMFGGRDARRTFELMDTGVCFVGHSHVPGIFSYHENQVGYFYEDEIKLSGDKKFIVNAGSVGQPRDRDPRLCYCVYDSESSLLQFKRITYDIEKAQTKILKAGLPPLLAHRLQIGI